MNYPKKIINNMLQQYNMYLKKNETKLSLNLKPKQRQIKRNDNFY